VGGAWVADGRWVLVNLYVDTRGLSWGVCGGRGGVRARRGGRGWGKRRVELAMEALGDLPKFYPLPSQPNGIMP